jgi:hypothetical protein
MTAPPLRVWVRGVGLIGPGLPDWARGRTALCHPASAWTRSATVVPAPERLPANERRRAGTVIKAALAAADQAVAMADSDPADLATVFTSSTGDPANCHALCEALATPERLVSPTRFTNSVHNAPAGYWHIATRSMRTSTSLAAYDASFGAGLLEAAVQCATGSHEVLLVACDVPYPEPLHALRPLSDTMAVALLLAPAAGGAPGARRALWSLTLELLAQPLPASPCAFAALEQLRLEIPAARALPLLCALAEGAGDAGAVGAEAMPSDAAGAGAGRVLQLEAAEGCMLRLTVEHHR